MELNINCDLGEKSEVFDAINDYELLKIINKIGRASCRERV